MKILSVVSARPNFMKIAPFIRAIEKHNHENGGGIQHFLFIQASIMMYGCRKLFFKTLNIPDPDINLEIGSGSHAEQIGYTMVAFEKVLLEQKTGLGYRCW